MKLKYFLITSLLGCLLVFGCTRKFYLEKNSEITPSPWPFGRNNPQATAKIDSDFSGRLNLKWENKINQSPVGPMTICADQLIVPASRGRIYFFHLKTGEYQGRYNARSNVQTGLTVVDSLAYFSLSPPKNRFICINLYNHKLVWREDLKDVTGTPIIIDDRLYLATADGWIECRDRMTGEIIWHDSTGARSPAGPSYDNEMIYYPFDDGNLKGYKALTGELVFSTDLQQPLVSKAALGDMVYVAGCDGDFSAIEKKTGQIKWQRKFDYPIWASPAVDENMVFTSDNGGIVRALDKNEGQTLWEYSANAVILASPIIVGDYLLFASLNNKFHCLDKKTGRLTSSWKTNHEIRFPAVSDGELIYIMTYDGTILCLED